MAIQNSSSGDAQYFAAKEAKDVASNALSKGETFFNNYYANDYFQKVIRMWRMYYGYYGTGGENHQVGFTGEQGELVTLPVNHLHNIGKHMLNMITSNRPVMEARAINTDYKSLAQTYVASGILEYYMREKKLEDAINKATEMAIILGSGFVRLEWNATAGDAYDVDPETGEFSYEGDVQFSTLSPFDCVFDGTKEAWDNNWLVVRSYKNKFDVAAKYPELQSKIVSMQPKDNATVRFNIWSNDDTDDIPVYEFFHKRTEALPDGRYILFLDADTILLDTKMPYRQIPIYRIAPSTIIGTAYGHTPMFELMPLQEGVNSLYSTVLTNQNAFGVQNVWMPPGANISVASLDGGMNIIESELKPEGINLTQTPTEVFKFMEILIRDMETLSGVNSVTRGNPEASLKSGNALALVQSMSLQFMSGLQKSYVQLIEDVGTSLLNVLKDFATTPKVIALVGKNNRTLLKEFTGEDINAISRVVVDVGNPLSRTIAGRVQMAEQMLQMGVIKNPTQYFQVINTGRLDIMFEGESHEMMLIKRENEQLMTGNEVMATMLDSHKIHIAEHKAVLADPELRANPELVQNTLNHIQEHLDYLKNADPAILAMIGEQSLAMPPQQPGQAPQGGGGAQQPPQVDPESVMMQTPDGPVEQTVAQPAKVDASLLPNPALQEGDMGNVTF